MHKNYDKKSDIFLLNEHIYVFNFTLISDIFENKAFLLYNRTITF